MFLAPLFLLGLIAIGVPIWLHRVARANPVHHPFPSLMLLEASETQRTAKRTLRYWLLLLLRILLIVALAFAFAGPLWQQERSTAFDRDTRLHAIVLDSSLSMQQGERWSRAIAAAESVIDGLRSSDQVMLIRASGRRMDIVHEAMNARDAGTLRAQLRSLTPGIERLDYGFAMSTAEQWLRTPRPPVLLHFISDFQQSAAPLRFADLEPPAGTQVLMHDVGAGTVDNAYIEHVSLSEGDTRSLEVGVRSTFAEPQRRTVIMFIDGKEHARREIELPAWEGAAATEMNVAGEGGGSTRLRTEEDLEDLSARDALPELKQVVFENVTFTPGAHRLEVRLEPRAGLPEDDRYFAVVEHANPQALLLTRNEQADDAAYFAAAIGALTAPRVEVQRQAAGTFDSASFGNYAVVVAPDIYALSSATVSRLERYLNTGGALLTTLGSGSRGESHALFPTWRIGDARPRLVSIAQIDTSHPVLRDAPEWYRVRFFRQRRVEIDEGDRVLIAQADGTPLLIERKVGAGKMLVLTAPIDRAWNDLAIHPVFVQFISQATRYLIGRDSSTASVHVGAPVTTGLTRDSGGQIFDPKGQRVLDLASTTNAERLVPTELGFYEIRHANGTRWVAVNSDRRESDLRRLPPGYIARWQALRQRQPEPLPAASQTQQRSEARSLGPALLWIAALLLIAELLMANRYLAVRREVVR